MKAPPADPAAAEGALPRSFPRWLRHFDPLLAREDGNHLFRLFKRRRLRARGRRMGAFLRLRHRLWMLPVLLVVLSACWYVFQREPLLMLLGIILTAILFPFLQERLSRTSWLRAAFPYRVCEVFSKSGFARMPAEQLWLSGARGRDVIEAIYLEKREGSALFYFFLFSVVGGWICWQLPESRLGGFMGWRLRAPMIYLLIEFYLFWLVFEGYRIKYNYIDDLIDFWQRKSAAGRILSRRIWTLVAIVTVFVFGCGAFQLIGTFAEIFSGSANARQWVATGLIVFAGVVLNRMRGILRDALSAGFEQSMRRVEYAFCRFMAETAIVDPDGHAWADWRFRVFEPVKGGLLDPRSKSPRRPYRDHAPVG